MARWRGRRVPVLEVQCGPGGPQRFVRAGRAYRVVAVLAHWHQAGPWWLDPTATEQEVWRVEVRPEGTASGSTGSGIHDLCHEGSSWRLLRTWD